MMGNREGNTKGHNTNGKNWKCRNKKKTKKKNNKSMSSCQLILWCLPLSFAHVY